ncbi:uncharacterized protein LOC113521426 [Galleria mellonella]|uniref:Uncharacterized protein LOC113521426 n=1 Tax=Galleria mellonella TaxID=7137 RepID=A0ABM3MUA0_GALME|nr:uncharacterized protein LOC113521426 [Galleria mellonella]
MVGVLFVVNVPQKEHETELRKGEKVTKFILEKEKYENAYEVIRELKQSKRFGSKSPSSDSSIKEDSISIMSKYNSTDCLHKSEKNVDLYKSRSENTLNNYLDSDLKIIKSPWDGIKQVIKPRKNKVKITKPIRGVDILDAFHWDTPLETILSEIIDRLNIFNATWTKMRDDKFWKVIFSLEAGNLCEELLQVLTTFGIGARHQSSVSVIPCTLYYKSNKNDKQLTSEQEKLWHSDTNSAWNRFSSSVCTRTNLAQVLHAVRADAALTFDWVFLLLVAAFVAAIGLVEDSTVILVASMLISPLMGPITAGTLGTAVRDRSLQRMGVMHEMLGLFLALVIGFVFGLVICAIDENYGVREWPTYEMMSRCEIRSLWVGVLVALPSGAGVALAVLGEYTASLVGAAISASLLPPAVNAGLLWAMALVHLIFSNDEARWTNVVTTANFSSDQATELALLGTVSLSLTLVNIFCIFIAGVVVYKVKEVCPLERRDISWWRENRNLLQASNNKINNNISWEVYSKWSNDPKETTKERKEAQGVVQSDTVTYRRHQIGKRRLRAQNIENYCFQKSQSGESYTPLDPETHLVVNTNDIKDEDKRSFISQNNLNGNSLKNNNIDYLNSNNYGFYNMGFDDEHNDDNTCATINTHPTIEPSLNYTVDAKNYGVVLGSKSFHV